MSANVLEAVQAKLDEQKQFIEMTAEKWGKIDQKYDERVKALEAKIAEEQAKVLALEKIAAEKAAFPLEAQAAQKRQDEFFKALLSRKAPAGQSTTDADGGYLMNEVLVPGILETYRQAWAMRPKVRIEPVALGDTVKITTDDSDVLVYRPGEGVAPEFSKLTLGRESLELTTVIALAALTKQIDINAPGFSNHVVKKIMRAMGIEEDRLLIKGRTIAKGGTDSYDGIIYADNVANAKIASGSTFTASTGDDFVYMSEHITDDNLAKARYGMHRSMFNHIRLLKESTTGALLFAPLANGAPATFNGYPIDFYNQMPARSATAVSTKFAFFGNLEDGCYIYERMGYSVAMSDSPLFTSAQNVIRVMGINGYHVAPLAGQIATLATNAQ